MLYVTGSFVLNLSLQEDLYRILLVIHVYSSVARGVNLV